ncbi:MAG: Crp/Fnr family transcriptional regulator [Thiobacillaceae bacterium]
MKNSTHPVVSAKAQVKTAKARIKMMDVQAIAPADIAQLVILFPALQGLDAGLSNRLTHELQWQRIPRGTELFTGGSPCRAFPLLLIGEIQVLRSSLGGREIELYRVRSGESCIVSTSCLLGETDYPARGVTLSDILLATLPRSLFETLIVAHPPFRRYVFSLFSQRLSAMMQRVEDVAFQSLTQRIAALLLHTDGDCLDTTHEALAGQIGASREAVSRTLKKLEAAACIKLTRGRIGISNRRKLSGWQ